MLSFNRNRKTKQIKTIAQHVRNKNPMGFYCKKETKI
jgi:hypothetical protein